MEDGTLLFSNEFEGIAKFEIYTDKAYNCGTYDTNLEEYGTGDENTKVYNVLWTPLSEEGKAGVTDEEGELPFSFCIRQDAVLLDELETFTMMCRTFYDIINWLEESKNEQDYKITNFNWPEENKRLDELYKERDNNNKLDFVYEQACPDCEIINATDKSECMQGGDLCCSKCGQVLLTKEELAKMDFFSV